MLSRPSHGQGSHAENPLLSSFNVHVYDAFCNGPKPVPCTFKANVIDRRVPLLCLDLKRCRASILKYGPWEWVTACAADELVQATPENVASLDFVWVRGRTYKTATKWVSMLPWQGPRFLPRMCREVFTPN